MSIDDNKENDFDEYEQMMRDERDLWEKIKEDDMWFDAWVSDALVDVKRIGQKK